MLEKAQVTSTDIPRALKVSVVVPNLARGGTIRAYMLGRVMQHLGHQVEIVGCLPPGLSIYPQPPDSLPVVPVQRRAYPLLARDIATKLDGDVIYALKLLPTSFGVALLSTLGRRRPIILDIVDWETSTLRRDRSASGPRQRPRRSLTVRILAGARRKVRQLRGPRGPLYRLYRRWTEDRVGRASAVTCNTRFLCERYGGVYLPNGIDTSLFDPGLYDPEGSRRRYGLSQHRVLMFPGTPRPHKGVEDVLAAMEELGWPDLRLVLVGGRKIDEGYAEALMDRWGKWIIRLPRYPFEHMPDVVSAAHVVVVPQRDTPYARSQFPIKLTDAMAMAKPIVSTRVGEIPEILGDTGFLVEPSSPNQIALQVERIFADWEGANEIGARARERCIQRFSIEAVGSVLSEVIRRSV